MNRSEIQHEHKTYEIVVATEVVPGNQPHPHAGEWAAKVTIYLKSESEPPQVQSFHDSPLYAGTEEEAIRSGREFGRQLVLGAIEGLKF
jgi:hypothetical protein